MNSLMAFAHRTDFASRFARALLIFRLPIVAAAAVAVILTTVVTPGVLDWLTSWKSIIAFLVIPPSAWVLMNVLKGVFCIRNMLH